MKLKLKKHIWQFLLYIKLLSFIIFTIFYVQDLTRENLENIKNYERKT